MRASRHRAVCGDGVTSRQIEVPLITTLTLIIVSYAEMSLPCTPPALAGWQYNRVRWRKQQLTPKTDRCLLRDFTGLEQSALLHKPRCSGQHGLFPVTGG